MEHLEEYNMHIKNTKIEVEIEMGQIIRENRTLEASVRIGMVAQEKLNKNKRRLEQLTRVYSEDDLDKVRNELRLLKGYLRGNGHSEFLMSRVEEIEQLLGGNINE